VALLQRNTGGDKPRILLLHGLAATGAVWTPLSACLPGAAQVSAPDLPGHGAAPRAAAYDLTALAAAVAGGEPDLIVGHSLGGYVALALASGNYGDRPRAVLSVGAKQRFTPEERAKAAELACRPARRFATQAEALERYRLVSGLTAGVAPDEAVLARGVCAVADGYALSTDPAALGIEVTPFAELLTQARCPVVLARGEHDPLVSAEEQSLLGRRVVQFAGCGHNAHVEDPAALAALIRSL
jgi:pimeloyl-ACP methyl ester carboxylesterase